MDKNRFLKVQLIDGEDNNCNFHDFMRDEEKKVIRDKKLVEIEYGRVGSNTTVIRICEECWDRLSVEVEKLLLEDILHARSKLR